MEVNAVRIAEGAFQFQVTMPLNPDRPAGRQRYILVYALATPEGWVRGG